MPGLLEKVAARTPEAEPRKKETVWMLRAKSPLGQVVTDLHNLEAEAKAIDGRINASKTKLKEFADREYVDAMASSGRVPGSPISIQNTEGLKVNFVVQERPSAAVKPEQLEALGGLLGVEASADLLDQVSTFSLNPKILALPGVQAVVEKALEGAIRKLRKAEVISQEQCDVLIEAETKLVFKPKTVDRAVSICGQDAERIRTFINAMGPSLTRYVKV